MPWLTLPFTHALRREQLRSLFELENETADAVVLLHMDGTTITRDGRQHMLLAYRCQSAIDEKKNDNDYMKSLQKLIDKERKHLVTLEKRLQKGVVAKLQRSTQLLCKVSR